MSQRNHAAGFGLGRARRRGRAECRHGGPALFRAEDIGGVPMELQFDGTAVAVEEEVVNTPVVKSDWDKTPRNAPCPCGSGKKFKQCHGV